jgi:C-terminal processing protease CtpA/Prc
VRMKEGGIASRDGRMQIGDVVVSIDGTDITEMKPMDAQKLLVGPVGTSALLEIAPKDVSFVVMYVVYMCICMQQTC